MHAERVFLPHGTHLADANAIAWHPTEKASWIWHPERPAGETAFLRFRLAFDLAAPASILLHVTADQRFQLRCDGEPVSFGPDRCDVEHWTVQSLRFDLGAGGHELEALVWWINDPGGVASRTDQVGADPVPRPPMAQMTWRGGFLLHSDDLPLGTGQAEWRVEDLTPAVRLFRQRIPHYFDVGPSHEFDLLRWAEAESSVPAVVMPPVESNPFGVRRPGWCLYATDLPEQRRQFWTGGRIRAVKPGWGEEAFRESPADQTTSWQDVLAGAELCVPAHEEVTVLWDMQQYRCGYPSLAFADGEGTQIEWDWAEALYDAPCTESVDETTGKGQRGEIEGKSFLGFGDRWHLHGAGELPFLWWRAGRYIRLRICAGDRPLRIRKLGILATGYPLERSGSWSSSDREWDRLFPIFENSYRCSAHEQWTDSPYYEQMGYVGDSLLHSLSNYVLFADDRVTRRSIELFDWSRRPSGLVAERYPSAWRQESVTYSMLWVMMVRDYVTWRGDPAYVQRLLPGVRSVLTELEALRYRDGLLAQAPGWPFVDWVPGWEFGVGPGVRGGDSSILNLHLVLCLQAAAEIEEAQGDPVLARRCRLRAGTIFRAILSRYWDEERGLLLDTPGCEEASEHAQVFALLTGLLDPSRSAACLRALREEGTCSAKTTVYASFYLLEALYRHGEEAAFHRRLDFWRGLPALGFTATPEAPEPSRSDAHAWGSHPAWHSIASIAGIRPGLPTFERIRIAPCPGPFQFIECSVPHPRGLISMRLETDQGHAVTEIELPAGLSGSFLWKGQRRELAPGGNRFQATAPKKHGVRG